MKGKHIIQSLFPELSPLQWDQFQVIESLYKDWNQKINLISRKDIEHLYLKHVLHSLLIGKWISFRPGTHILDVGTGGGFPGIPLAILFPEVEFHLVDSIRKKINVVHEVAADLNLLNVRTSHQRVEELQGSYDFIVARAVAKINVIRKWTQHVVNDKHRNMVPNGWLLLKGGDLAEELNDLPRGSYYEKIELFRYCDDPYFNEKYLIYLQA